MNLLILSVTAILTLTICTGFGISPQGSTVTVKVGQENAVPGTGISVKFIEVMEDGRCPSDVNCVWAGNAKIKLQFSKGSETKITELNTAVKPQSVEFCGYSFKIDNLIPHPRTNVRINRLGYEATLSAKRI